VYTAKILQAFDSRNLAASFHVLTARLNNQEQLNQLRAAINRGHIIGIRFPIDMVPNNMTEGQLISTLLSESESFNSRFGRYPRFLRFPWQQFNNTAVLIAQKMGFVVTTWSLDALDYQVASLQEIESFLKVKVLPGVPAISIHRDIYEIYNNSDNFGKLIDWVSVSQLSVVGLDKCVGVTTDLWRPDNRDPRILLLTTQPNGNKPTTVPTTAPGGGDFGGNSVSTGTGRMALLGNPWLTFILLLFSVVVLF
jgi:hypothetical protein